MRPRFGVPIENAETMSAVERLETAFTKVADISIEQIKREVEAAKAAKDKERIKLSQIKMSMFRHGKEIYGFARQNAKTPAGYDLDRLEDSFINITNKASSNMKTELEAAQAIGDEAAKKIYHLQISMYQNLQQIFKSALKFATDSYWRGENEGE